MVVQIHSVCFIILYKLNMKKPFITVWTVFFYFTEPVHSVIGKRQHLSSKMDVLPFQFISKHTIVKLLYKQTVLKCHFF